MSESPSRRFILLSAYEDFTRRETVCIREEDFDRLESLQSKKEKVIAELSGLADSPTDTERADFNRRIEALLESERSNEALLTEKMASNRQAYRKLTANAVAANKLRRAYGPANDRPASPGNLQGRA